MDVKAQQQFGSDTANTYTVCNRRHPRNPFRVGCQVRFYPVGSSDISELSGRTRNLSRSGIGLLVRRVFTLGEAVEVELNVPQRPKMYMAGIVRFCRYVGRGFHEVGIELRKAGDKPFFTPGSFMAHTLT